MMDGVKTYHPRESKICFSFRQSRIVTLNIGNDVVDSLDRELAVYTYTPDGGVYPYPRERHRYFLTCQVQGPYRFLISLSITIRHPLQWIGVTGPEYVVHVMGELASTDRTSFVQGPNVEVRRLHDISTGDAIFLIRGIQPAQFAHNLGMVVRDVVFKDPCPFEFATAAVKHIARKIVPQNCQTDMCADPRYAEGDAPLHVVGHSMGGSAVQYIASDYAKDPAEYGNVVMDSYSFNSYGTEYPGANPGRNFSYCTENDFACKLAQTASRYQPGTHVIYYPSNGSASGHKIASVQEQICNCRTGVGGVDIDPP